MIIIFSANKHQEPLEQLGAFYTNIKADLVYGGTADQDSDETADQEVSADRDREEKADRKLSADKDRKEIADHEVSADKDHEETADCEASADQDHEETADREASADNRLLKRNPRSPKIFFPITVINV